MEIKKDANSFVVKFVLVKNRFIEFDKSIPNRFIAWLRSCFECKVLITTTDDYASQKAKNFKQNLPFGLFTSIFICAGIGLIMAHKYVEQIPLFLGVFFVFGGAIGFCGAMGSKNEIVHDTIIPMLFGGMLLGFIAFIMDMAKLTNPFLVFAYQPFTIVLVMFISISILLIMTALYKLIKIIIR